MTDAPFVIAGYGISAVVLAVFTVRTFLRGRKLTKQVPARSRRWS